MAKILSLLFIFTQNFWPIGGPFSWASFCWATYGPQKISIRIKYNSLVNHINISFKKILIIFKILYNTDNCNSCEGIGYPIKLNVFGKLKKKSDNALDPYGYSDFFLIDNITSEATQNKVMFFFEKSTKRDQIKIELGEMKTNSPRFPKMTTAEEIMFFF